MPTIPEYYRILGVSPKAGLPEVKRRFRLLALKFHPDRNPHNPDAATRFREVAEAYGAICNCRHRQPHPVTGEDQQRQKSSGAGERAFAREHMAEFFGFEDISPFSTSFDGPDYRYDLQVPFLDAMWGLEQEIEFRCFTRCGFCQATGLQPGSYYQDCPTCAGRGRRWASPGQLKIGAICDDCQGHGKIIAHPCPYCAGQGYQQQLKKYRIVIPPGVEDGTRILINGKGGEGFRHGPPGHLVVVVHVEPHGYFTRRGNDLHCSMDISFAQAILGDSIEIPTLSGTRVLDLPRGTRSGQSFLFPGLGVPAAGNCQPGNLVITIYITNKTKYRETNLKTDFFHSRKESK